MCAPALWRALGHTGQPPRAESQPVVHDADLGPWAVKLFRYEGLSLVLAVDERTLLALVFPVPPAASFRQAFATALDAALTDLGVAMDRIARELFVIDLLPYTRLEKGRLAGPIEKLDFLCRCELDYLDDTRVVQRNLNEVPHADRNPCTAEAAVARLFSQSDAPPLTRAVH